jgi:two-component system, cell cycle sensor histidine kinase and response regulator CckA
MIDGNNVPCCLLVDDQATLRELASEFLRSYPLEVLEAHDGASALEISRGHEGPIHLLISDVGMPGMSGLELAAELRRERREISVLFTTGYSTDMRKAGARAAILVKPFSGEELRAAVAALLAGKSG